ncbi:hypothetical protein [Agromyces larvae]|uniref:Uncharacterized protein n=1 Tax=Agromyces larvae TaxID=2929802 RepID=A0ABY4BYZ6_9MICO|nr:hypothetical protein [Agromyces larvae]UOE43964.1 hypothetical protein MTO99_17665 [Agromyces larvae]
MSETRNPVDPAPGEVEERTFVIERPRPSVEPYADFEERTIVVGRDPVDVDDDAAFDRTIVVGPADGPAGDRGGAGTGGRTGGGTGADAGAGADEFDRTVVVGRAGIAVAADALDEERTIVPGAAAHGADATVQTGRGRAPVGPRRRRRTLTPAPLDPATLRPSVPGRGAGAVEAYPARPVPTRITPMPVVMDETPPTRDVGAKPSVARRARRDAVAGLVAVGASVVLSVSGLIALALIVPLL